MTKSDWISVYDRMPAPGSRVLTSRKETMYTGKRTISLEVRVTDILSHTVEQLDDYWVTADRGERVEGIVTHWMSLPKPPEE